MGAPEGNQFWKQRSKHGRDKIFKTPESLWETACEYFEWCDANPLKSVEQARGGKSKTKAEVTEGGISVEETGLIELPLMRAYTWSGLELFLGIDSLRDYKTNEDYKDFSQVIRAIDKIIYTQKFEGAAAGLLNANIIARDLGLRDKQDLELAGEIQLFAPTIKVVVSKEDGIGENGKQ